MKNLIKTLFAITLCLPFTLSAQQWSGTGNTTSAISRTGQVEIDNTTTVRRLHIKTNTVTNNPDISLSAQAMIETESNMFLNIDSDNDTENAHFTVGKNSPTTTGYTPLFRIYETGKVGIGRTNPLQRLDVAGNIRLGAGTDAYLQNTTGYIGVRPADGMHGFIIRDYTGQSTHWSGLRHVDNGNADRLEFSVMNNDYGKSLVITQNKRVGIGIENPEYKLHVADAARIKQVAIGGNADGTGFHDGITGTWSLQLNAAKSGGVGGDIVMRSEGAEKMIVKSSGNVGIGTPNPTQKLHVSGGSILCAASIPAIDLKETGSNITWSNKIIGGAYYLSRDNSTKLFINTLGDMQVYGDLKNQTDNDFTISAGNNSDLILKTHGNDGLTIDKNGYITMGLDNIDGAVKVKGGICITPTGNQVCPDYVFEDSYELKSLEEVKKFIQENKHLPNVPSAKQIEENGSINVVDMTYVLLEKVEELTLYTIQQQEEIAKLKQEIQTIKN